MLPAGLVSWVYSFGDRFFIERFIDLRNLGIYSILIAITGLVTMVSDSVLNGIQPYIYDYYSNGIEKNKENINVILRLYIHAILLVCSFLILLGCNLDLFIVNKGYLEVHKFVSIGVIVFLLEAYYKIYFNDLLYLKNSKAILYISISSAFFVFVLYVIFIPLLGILGAIVSNILCNSLMLAIALIISRKKIIVPLNSTHLIIIPVIIAAIFISTEAMVYFEIYNYSVLSICQFILVLLILTIANGKEIEMLRNRRLID